ncbi:MAG: DUF2227 family putative metal-binding protein, partial [Chloroflexota bacterium]
MPGYRVHDKTTLAAAILGAAAAFGLTRAPAGAAIVGVSTLVSGTMLSPDLDVFVNPSWKYVLFPYGGVGERLHKIGQGLGQVRRFGA